MTNQDWKDAYDKLDDVNLKLNKQLEDLSLQLKKIKMFLGKEDFNDLIYNAGIEYTKSIRRGTDEESI